MIKKAEGAWVQAVIAPLFLIVALLCSIAGAEYAGLPAVDSINLALHGGKLGTQVISFSKTRGFSFPALAHSSPAVSKIFNNQIKLDSNQELVPRNDQSLQQTLDTKSR